MALALAGGSFSVYSSLEHQSYIGWIKHSMGKPSCTAHYRKVLRYYDAYQSLTHVRPPENSLTSGADAHVMLTAMAGKLMIV